MIRRWLILSPLCLLLVACSLSGKLTSSSSRATGATGFLDLHNSALYRMFSQQDVAGLDRQGYAISKTDLDAIHARFMVFSMGVPRFSMKTRRQVPISEVIEFLRAFRGYAEMHYPDWQYAGSQEELDDALAQGKMPWTLALESAWLMKGDLRWVDTLYELGVRAIQPGHRFVSDFLVDTVKSFGPTWFSPSTHFSPKGIALLDRMAALGMVVDVSHLPERAFWEVVAWNQGKVRLIASHANAHALCGVARNLTDEQIRAIAATDGLIGVCVHRPMLDEEADEAGIPEVVAHIQHLLAVAGPSQVAIGTDWEGLISPARGLEKVSQLHELHAALSAQGMDPQTIEAVLWRNGLRLFAPIPH